MIYDCFSFFNELDLLEIRLNVLKDVVDKFVLVEATRTHTGRPKPLYYEENKARFKDFQDRIVHIVVDDLMDETAVAADTFNNPWINENRQRNALAQALESASDDDIVLVSDLDEIPRPEKFAEACQMAAKGEIVRFKLRIYMYFANFRSYRDPWWLIGTQMMSVGTFRHNRRFDTFVCDRFTQESVNLGHTMTKFRFVKPTRVLSDAGWHFGYFGGIEAIKAKLRASSHFEVQNVIKTVEARLSAGENIFGGKRDCFAVAIDEEPLPQYLVTQRNRFSALFFEVTDDYRRRTSLSRKVAWIRGALYRFCVRLVPRPLVAPLSRIMIKFHFR